MAFSLLPKSPEFFDLFERHAALTLDGVKRFREFLEDLSHATEKAKAIKEIEHRADEVAHQTVDPLHRTFLPPFDRDDIHRLITKMDDILDAVEAAAVRIGLYELSEATPECKELARILQAAVEAMILAVEGLRDVKHGTEAIHHACVEVNRLENEGDATLRLSLAKLFKEGGDPLRVIKWKEIYENLERATDRCEDVVDIIEGVVLENE